jgi:hypothetical protein
MNPSNFFAELKRRYVYRVAIAYGVVAWLLIQIATQVFPFFEIPNFAVRLVVLVTVLGFPIAVIIAWALEMTPEGLKRATDIAPSSTPRQRSLKNRSRFCRYLMKVALRMTITFRMDCRKN